MAENQNMNSQNNEVQNAVNTAIQAEKSKRKKKKLIILGVIAGVILLIIIASLFSSGSKSDTGQETTTSISASSSKEQDSSGKIGKYACTVKSAELCKDYEGKDAVKITYTFTNNSNDAASFDLSLNDEVYQNGVQLETAYLFNDDNIDYGLDVKIKTGNTKDVTKVYVLNDTTTELEVEISELISFSNDKLTYNVTLE